MISASAAVMHRRATHMRTEAWTLLRTAGYSADDCQRLGGVIWLGLPHTPV
jgi:hypothetical protein